MIHEATTVRNRPVLEFIKYALSALNFQINKKTYFLGHVYCITECGGAMQEANCPECGSRIGGTNHALRQDNTLASDMDGARHARWSDFTNINNFDLRDLN